MPKKPAPIDLEEIKVSCQNCTLVGLCLPHGLAIEELERLDQIVVRHKPLQPGQHLYRAGDKSHALFAVRSGALKNYCITEDGEEQVIGFTLPCELSGMDGLSGDHYSSASVVLETSSICELPYERLQSLCSELPSLHKQMMNIVGKQITEDQHLLMLLGKRTAEERLAAFLLSLSNRYHARGLSATEFNLPMSRQDIGNYLGLAIETVSRLFAQFQEKHLLEVSRRQVRILDLDAIRSMVQHCMSYSASAGR